jgi:hypothetical protein
MAKYLRRWIVGAMISLAVTSGATAVIAAPAGVGEPGDGTKVATGEPPIPLGASPTTTIVIVATDDPPLPPLVATGPPPIPPAVTNVSPKNPGTVILPETGSHVQVYLALIATLLLGAGIGMQQTAARRRMTPVLVNAHFIR